MHGHQQVVATLLQLPPHGILACSSVCFNLLSRFLRAKQPHIWASETLPHAAGGGKETVGWFGWLGFVKMLFRNQPRSTEKSGEGKTDYYGSRGTYFH